MTSTTVSAPSPDGDKLARQHALSHAMGALLLESKVADLEQSVERERARRRQGCRATQGGGGGGGRCGRDGAARRGHRETAGTGGAPSRSHDGHSPTKSQVALPTPNSREHQQEPRQREDKPIKQLCRGSSFLRVRSQPLAKSLDALGRSARTSPASSTASSTVLLSASASSLPPSSSSAVLSHSSGSSKGKEKGKEAAMARAYASGVRVVDVSVLIYSLRSVHSWLREGELTLIVPYGALHTLDLLKGSKDMIGHAARKALCFLEERLTDGSPLVDVPADASAFKKSSSSSSTSSASGSIVPRCRPGLFIQGTAHAWTETALSELRAQREATQSLPVPAPEGDRTGQAVVGRKGEEEALAVPLLARLSPTPRHIRDVLTCAYWLRDEAGRRVFDASGSDDDEEDNDGASTSAGTGQGEGWEGPMARYRVALAVAYPPPTLRHGDLPMLPPPASYGEGSKLTTDSAKVDGSSTITSTGTSTSTTLTSTTSAARLGYDALADGSLTHRWALAFGFGDEGEENGRGRGGGATVEVLPTATSWLEVGDGNGNGKTAGACAGASGSASASASTLMEAAGAGKEDEVVDAGPVRSGSRRRCGRPCRWFGKA